MQSEIFYYVETKKHVQFVRLNARHCLLRWKHISFNYTLHHDHENIATDKILGRRNIFASQLDEYSTVSPLQEIP